MYKCNKLHFIIDLLSNRKSGEGGAEAGECSGQEESDLHLLTMCSYFLHFLML